MNKQSAKKGASSADASVFNSAGVQIGMYIVKPWTIIQIAGLSRVFEDIYHELNKRNFTAKKLEDLVETQDESVLAEMLFVLMQYLPSLLVTTLHCTQEELESMPPEICSEITITMVKQNINYLKNFLSPFKDMMQKEMKSVKQ